MALTSWLKKAINSIKTRRLSLEAATAYFHKLPNEVDVHWFREGDFIVGEIRADGKNTFLTQALSAKEFVEMVNETLFAAYEIPEEYFDVLQQQKRFIPPPAAFEQLKDIAIKKSELSFRKLAPKQLATA